MQWGMKSWILAVVVVAVAECRTIDTGSPTSCMFGKTIVADGAGAMHVTEKCMSLFCQKGKIVEKIYGEPGDTGCCYARDDQRVNNYSSRQCLPVVCRNGTWFTGNFRPCCAHCQIYGYSHFTTFDGRRFDWHGSCNYTLVNLAARDDEGLDAGAIYAEMTRVGSCATVFGRVTLRGDSHTVINMSLDANGKVSDQIALNGVSMTIPPEGVVFLNSSAGQHKVLTYWRNDCLMFLSLNRLTLRYCPLHMDIWVPRELNGFVDGLCGRFNYDPRDDFITPAGQVLPYETYPVDYADKHWLSPDQHTASCNGWTTTSICNGTTGNKCMISASDLRDYGQVCEDFLTQSFPEHPSIVDYYRSPCVADLCLASQGDVDFSVSLEAMFTEILNNYKNIAMDHVEDLKITPALMDVNMCSAMEGSTSIPVNEETVPTTSKPH